MKFQRQRVRNGHYGFCRPRFFKRRSEMGDRATCMEAILAETEDRDVQLPVRKGCRMRTLVYKGVTIAVHVYLSTDPAGKGFDVAEIFGQRYQVKPCNLFPGDKKTMREHPIVSGGEGKYWELIVTKIAGSDAPLQGFISNKADSPGKYVGEDENFVLEPVLDDVMKARFHGRPH